VFYGLLAMLVLILGNGFFVIGEFALVSVDRTKIDGMADEGHRRAQSVQHALKTLSFQLSGAQLGITITSLLIGFIAEPTLGRALEPVVERLPFVPNDSSTAISIGAALVIATATQMVVSELIPQNLAISRPLGVSLAVSTPLRLFNTLFKPLIVFLNQAANWTVRLLGIEPRDELSAVHSLEELEVLIHSSGEEGALPPEDFQLLSRSITFEGKVAADALVPRTAMVAIQKDKTLQEMADLAVETGHSRFPVYDQDLDDIAGIAYVKDLYRVGLEARSTTPVTEAMRPALVVPESRDLVSLLAEMRRERLQMTVVIDEFGGTAGILTLEDLVEEIVGEIEDEYDPSEPVERKVPKGVFVIDGLARKDEVAEACGFEIPDGDYDTLAGFLLELFGRIPEVGDQVSYLDWELKVTAMDGKRIEQVLLVRVPGTGERS
jgi:CBS domain containing-hemolysin-like protein